MRSRGIGSSGMEASVITFGAWAIGGWMWGGCDEDEAIRAVHAALDAGVTMIDTAPIYGFGRSEEIVGKAIAHRRDRVLIATKCGLRWDAEGGEYHFSTDEQGRNAEGPIKVYKNLRPKSIRHEIEQSLKRLGVETIDLYQTHWQDSTTPIEDTMTTLVELKTEGKIRAIGVCNATTDHMDDYRGIGALDSDQEKYSMLDRKPESAHLPYCREHNLAFLAYSPLANGMLTGKIGPDRTFGPGDLRNAQPRFQIDNRRKVQALLDEIAPLANQRGITLAQLVLAWTLHQPGVTHLLVGARNEDQASANAAAGDITLSEDEVKQIDAALERHPGIV